MLESALPKAVEAATLCRQKPIAMVPADSISVTTPKAIPSKTECKPKAILNMSPACFETFFVMFSDSAVES